MSAVDEDGLIAVTGERWQYDGKCMRMEAKMMRLSLLFMVTTFMVKDVTSFCAYHKKSSSPITINQENNNEHPDKEEDNNIIPSFHRRSLLLSTIFCGTHCSCCCGFPSSANALVELTQQEPSSSNNNYLLRPRSKLMDNIFAQQMATGMVEYEKEVEQYKADLFQKLFDSLGDAGHSDNVPVVIVEVGMGTFPNAKLYAQASSSSALNTTTLDIVGVDPNESMVTYARDAYERELLGRSESSFRSVKGIAEALPFSDRSVDVVVSTLTLCSVVDQQKTLSEIRRVLKPNDGKFLFWEHVLSEDNSALALQQTLLNPLQKLSSDGCHLNRRTGINIEKVFGKGRVDVNYITLGDKWVIGPTAFGIATA